MMKKMMMMVMMPMVIGSGIQRRIIGFANAFDQQLSILFDQCLSTVSFIEVHSLCQKDTNLSHRFQRFDVNVLNVRTKDFDRRFQITK